MANQASGASSSSAASSSNSTSYSYFDVFINHRGPDVKNTFAAHLYDKLRYHGLQVFLDKSELLEGHPISPQICAAIKVASLHIAIFSPTYAESKWCLDELVLMLNSNATILPVFYNVKPYQLRWTAKDGTYAEALRGLEQKKSDDAKPRHDSNTIRSWRDALVKAADISGFELQGGDEGELLTKVVQRAVEIVSKPPLHVAKYPTGVDDKLQEFEATLLQQREQPVSARVVGIVGFGGIGKTTLAKTFFNRKRSDYSASSFLFDVRETSAKFSLSYLQSKLIEDLKHIKSKNIKIENPGEGVEILRRYLLSCKALVILDDVDSVNQLEVLLPIKDILSPESLILITSRDKHVLKSSGVLESSIYSLKGLNTKHSKELFCSYAFHQPLSPPQEFELLVDRFVIACAGLPLSLKVVGALVCGEEDKVYWEEQLDLLQQTPPSEIQERLRVSYESLTKKDQEMFLDIACFFLGEQRDKAIRIWGLVGLRNLEDKCLLEVDSQSKIRMHDHIRDFARNIAEQRSMSRRLWHRTNIKDDLLELTHSGITEVRGITTRISFDVFQIKDWQMYIFTDWRRPTKNIWSWLDPFNDSKFCGLRNLQLVAAQDCDLKTILRRAQFPHLLWLRWNGCYDSSLPAWIPMENLRVLEVSGPKLNSLWPHQYQGPLQLRELNIYAPLSEFPKSIGQLQHLERIVISYGGAEKPTVKFLPEHFGHLCSLKYLVLKNFSKMMSLPDSFGKLTNLRHIDLGGASSLQMLANSFCDLSRLEHLCLQGATSIKSLPHSFGKLTNLRHIDLGGASSLQMLPNSFCDLSRLEHLSLQGATSIKSLPDSFGKLTNLRHIDLGGASSLQMLRNSFGDLSRLEHLSLQGATSIKSLPESFGKLNLRHIDLGGASSLLTLPNYFTRNEKPETKFGGFKRGERKH